MDHAERSIAAFLDGIASAGVTPAGGSAAGVVGATGAALCEMGCLHAPAGSDTEVAGGPGDLDAARADVRERRESLLELADADAAAVDALLSADDVGGAGDAGAATRAAKRATGVPLSVAEACLAVLEVTPTVVEHTAPNAVPDVVTGATLAHAALRAAVYTVRANLDAVDDDGFVDDVRRRAADVETAAESAYAEAMAAAEGDG